MESLGSFLRDLRRSRGLTQADLARAAEIGRVTLNRWEKDAQQPRIADLEAFLRALDVTETEARRARLLLSTPQTRAQERSRSHEINSRVAERTGIGPAPHGGDLLRTLRLRQGLSMEDAARRVGVGIWTLRRWEKSELCPSLHQLRSLCSELQAHPAEMLALASGGFLTSTPTLALAGVESQSGSLGAQIDSIEERGRQWHTHSRDAQTESLKELGFLALEREAWTLAARSRQGQRVLSHLYSYHAQYLSSYEQWEQCGIYATRALDLLLPGELPNETHLLAALALAKSATHRGAHPRPQRGIEILKHWTDATHLPDYKAWLMGDIAKYMAQSGEAEQGLQLLETAKQIAARCENPAELWNREIDVVQILLWQGKYDQALVWTHDAEHIPPQYLLLEVMAHLKLQQHDLAYERLQDAVQLIERHALVHLRARAQKLALQF